MEILPDPSLPSPERPLLNPLKQLRLKIDNPEVGRSNEAMEAALKIEGVIGALNFYSVCSRDFFNRIQKIEGTDDKESYSFRKAEINRTLSLIAQTSEDADELTSTGASSEDRSALRANLIQAPAILLGSREKDDGSKEINYPEDVEFIDVLVSSDKELLDMSRNLFRVNHDAKTSTTALSGYLQMIDLNLGRGLIQEGEELSHSYYGRVADGFRRMGNYVENEASEKLRPDFPKVEVSVLDFQGVIDSEIKPKHPDFEVGEAKLILSDWAVSYLGALKNRIESRLSYRDNEEDRQVLDEISKIIESRPSQPTASMSPLLMDRIQFVWSIAQMEDPITNAAENSEKSFLLRDKLFHDDKGPRRTEEGKHIDPYIEFTPEGKIHLILRDNGAGVADEIEAGGILEGATKWDEEGSIGGTGRGLNEQRMILKEHYDADVLLRSVTDESRLFNDRPLKVGAETVFVFSYKTP